LSGKRDTRRKILDAAKAVFSEKGYDASSLEDIASKVNVKKTLIFYYFPSKENLFLTAWNEGIDELEEHIFREVEGENTYIRKIKKLLRSYIDFVMSKKEIMKLIEMDKAKILENHNSENSWESMKVRYGEYIRHIKNLIDEGKNLNRIPTSISSDSVARLIAQSMAAGAIDENVSLENIMDFILLGILPRGENI